jgi:pilus assembly protein CpaF
MQSLGFLDEFLQDESVTEIMVNGPSQIYVEKEGRLQLTDKKFVDDKELYLVIENILAPLAKKIDEQNAYVDARLADGSRVNIIIPPISMVGPMITIRKFFKKRVTGGELIALGSCNQSVLNFLQLCVAGRKNIVISGGTGSGKTTLLNIVSSFIKSDERILTIEDTAELRLNQEHVGRLEARIADSEGKGTITIRQLVINALRMRPDRIVVGECRGQEAFDMLQAMNTGHDGSLTTIHSNSPRDCLKRLESMVLMAGIDIPARAIREQIASAINIVVQIARLQDGSRKIVNVTQITGMEGETITIAPIFEFKQTGLDKATRKVVGEFRATGTIPTFLEELKVKGMSVDMDMFS